MSSTQAKRKCIVVFKSDTPQEEIDFHAEEVKAQGGTVTNVYNSVLKGFAAIIPESHLSHLNSLTGNGPVDYIEDDGMVTIQTF